MILLAGLSIAIFIGGIVALAYCAGRQHGEDEARDAYLEALDWLAEQHKANNRRMREA